MHSRSARVSTRVSKALARLNWTVGWAAGRGHGPALYRRPATVRPGAPVAGAGSAIGKDQCVDVRNPATGEVITKVEGLTAAETDAAIARAAAAFERLAGRGPGRPGPPAPALRRRGRRRTARSWPPSRWPTPAT